MSGLTMRGIDRVVERLKDLFGQIFDRLRTMPPAKLFLLLALAGSGIALVLVSMLWIQGRTENRVLYAHLNMEDAADIANKLQEMQVPYTLRGDGTTIMVPATVVHDTRLRLATDGLPRGGGAGFELFDQRSFGMTEFMQKLNYRRALQGELARTISQLGAVLSARVHIVIPEKSLFLDQQDKTTASVVLKLAAGRRLSPEQIHGIAHLVASSVEGLQADDITLVDNHGKRLNGTVNDPSKLMLSEAQLAYQHMFEQTLENRVQSLLARAIGQDKVLVRVSATLDLQRVERSEERFDADNPAIRSEQRSTEEGQGSGFLALGVPGVRSNVTDPAKPNDQQTNKTSRQSETINYEVSKVTSTVVAPSGDIKRLSVAVLVDGTYQPGQNEGETTFVPRTEEELEKYREIVKGAVGYDESRGDRLEIVNVPFEVPDQTEEQLFAVEAERSFWLEIGRYGAYAFLGLLVCFFIVRPVMKSLTAGPELVETTLPRTVQELEAEMSAPEGLPSASLDGQQLPAALSPEGIGSQQLRQQVTQLVIDEPERTAEILRLWLRT